MTADDQKPTEEEVPPRKALIVLVVDDEPGFRNLLQWELKSRGMQVETAENGAIGVQLAGKTKYDVIITDITMPEKDGLKLLDEVKKINPETEVIIATGFGAVETAVHAMKRGAFDFVLKPYDLEHLMARVRQAVECLSHCQKCGGRVHHE
jgi:DNA-binding NtrC family response regulator